MRNLNCRFTSFDLEVMLLLANQRAAWAFTFIHFDSLKYYKSTEVLQLLQYCNYYSYYCCSSSAMNQLMLLCISNQVFKCVWCFLCVQFLTFLMSHVINMTFFNQVQSIRILYLCKSITEAAWKYLCKSPDSSQALFSHLSLFILSHSGSSPSCLCDPARPSNI